MDTAQLLLEFSSLQAIPGREFELFQTISNYLSPYGELSLSPLGSIICQFRKPKENGVHILLDAHLDEIGLIVTQVGEDGFLKVDSCGGVDPRLIMASALWIHTKSGSIPGVVCSIPPHLSKGERKNPKINEIYVDCGLTPEQAKEQIRPGDAITFQSTPAHLLGNRITGKALDDRSGCVALIKALEWLKEEPLDCGLTLVFSAMEEVGGQGAQTAAWQLNPTHSLVIDTSFGHTPDAKSHECGSMGAGPMIGHAPLLNYQISRQLEDIAQQENIPYQSEVMTRRTGTNADEIAMSRDGVKTALVSIPLRYMHTPQELVDIEDVENTARLVSTWVKSMSKGGETA